MDAETQGEVAMSEELILSPSDPQWHERRREVYTASDMGVLFGLPGFAGKTLSDVWFQKRFGLVADKGTPSTRLGQKMEPLILDQAEEVLGTRIIDRQLWVSDGQMGATLDGRCENDGRVAEAKTSGLLWKADDEWGDETDAVPSAIILQVQCQIHVTKASGAVVPAIIGGKGFMLYEVERHDGIIAEMQRRVAEFMRTLEHDQSPESPPTLDTLKRIRRQPNKIIERSDEIDELWQELQSAKADAKATENIAETIQRRLLAAIGDAEAVETSGGLITYFQQTNRYPARLPSESTFRVLRFAKGK